MMQKIQNGNLELENIDLFENVSAAAAREKRHAKGQELKSIAARLRNMFRELSNELLFDRDRSLALMAEYGGMLSEMAGQINCVREGQLGHGLDAHAEKLEQGVNYLMGYFAAYQPDPRTWTLDRSEIKVSIQKVWSTVRVIINTVSGREDTPKGKQLRKAA